MTAATVTRTAPSPAAPSPAPATARPAGSDPADLQAPRVQRVAVAVAVFGLPLLRPGGPGNTGLVDVGLLLVLASAAGWASRSRHQLRFPYVVPVGLLVLGGALAALRAGLGPSVLLTLGQDVYTLVWGMVLANLVIEPALLRTAVRALAVSGMFWATVMLVGVFGHVPALSGITDRDGNRASLTLGDPNLAANYFLVALLVLRAAQYPRRRPLRWAGCALIVTAMFFTGSNGGGLTLVVATVLGLVLGTARRHGATAAVAVGLLLGAGGAVVASQVDLNAVALRAQASSPALRDSIGRQAESGSSRTALAAEAVDLWRSDGLVGVGPGRTKEALLQRQAPYIKEAHDDYAAAFVERGLIGGAALVLLVGALLVRAARVAGGRLHPDYAAVLPRPELLAAAVVAILLSALFYEVLHYRHVWTLFGLVAGVDLWGRQDDRERS